MKPLDRAAMLPPSKTYNASGIRLRAMLRKSRLLTVTVALLTIAPFCCAQTQATSLGSAIELARADMTSERNEIVTAAMQLRDKDAAAFWPIYRKYEYERSLLDDSRAAVVKAYAEKYSTITDSDAKSMTERMLEYESREIALKRKYFKEFSKVLPAITVAQFFQLDHRVDILMAVKVESSLPPLGRPQNTEQLNAEQQHSDTHSVELQN